jgi:hypothetical protein
MLRVLQLEEMEDGIDSDNENDQDNQVDGGGDGGEEGSVGSTSKSRKRGVSLSTVDEPTSIVTVPENHSLQTIKAIYRNSCSKMLAVLPDLEVDFTSDQTQDPNFRSDARTKLQFARRVLKASTHADHKVAEEYRMFLSHCALRRTSVALRLSEAMQQAAQLEASFRSRYNEAASAYQRSPDAQLAASLASSSAAGAGAGATAHHPGGLHSGTSTSKHMQAIMHSVEVEIARQGEMVKELQNEEAKLVLNIRYLPIAQFSFSFLFICVFFTAVGLANNL